MKIYIKRLAILITSLVVGSIAAHDSAATLARSLSGKVIETGNLTMPRFDHTATLLPNGKVLVAAGMEHNGAPCKTAELYDPHSGQFTNIGEMKLNHGWGSIAVLLQNGKVLLAGGSNTPSVALSGAEIYDPASNTFSLTASMNTPRDGAIAIAMQNGLVLIVGGEEGSKLSVVTAELYNPSRGVFSTTGSMHTKDITTAVLLKSGKVLVVGPSNAELYDPLTGSFTITSHLKYPRTKFGAALLPDGKVLVAGGQINGAWGERVPVSEVYDPATGTFSTGPEMTYKRFKMKKSIVTLNNGRVLVGGGADQPEVYDPTSRSFLRTSGTKIDGFLFSTATLLGDGEVLLVGGYNVPGGVAVSHAWLYQP